MKTTIRLCAVAVFMLVSVTCGPSAMAGKPPRGGSGPTYQMIQLQTEPKPEFYFDRIDYIPHEMNDSGLIVGTVMTVEYVELPDGTTGDKWTSLAAYWKVDQSTGVITSTLGYLKWEEVDPSFTGEGKAYGVNNQGEIVGWRSTVAGKFCAVYWADFNAIPVDLNPLAGDTGSIAEAINKEGVICGHSFGDGPAMRPVVWKVGNEGSVQGPVPLPVGDNEGSDTVAVAINDNDLVGVAQVVGYGVDALVWDVVLQPNGSLTAPQNPRVLAYGASAEGVNNSAQICGQIPPNGVVWSGTSTQPLDMSATIRVGRERRSVNSAYPLAINATSSVVGYAASGLSTRAVVWQTPTQPMVVLDNFLGNSPFTHLDVALDINGSGHVVGCGATAALSSAGFLAIRQ